MRVQIQPAITKNCFAKKKLRLRLGPSLNAIDETCKEDDDILKQLCILKVW